MTRWFSLVLVALMLYGGGSMLFRRPSSHGAAPVVDPREEPEQEALGTPEQIPIQRDGRTYRVEKHHRYTVTGQVLSTATYNITFASDFFDVDLGLIWGPRIEDLLERYHFFQDGRWLFWRSEGEVDDTERAYITSHVANNHLIPAEGRRELDKAIRWAAKGDLVRIEGSLVTIRDEGGAVLASSSTSRHDTGDGACEIIWVDEIQIGRKVYR